MGEVAKAAGGLALSGGILGLFLGCLLMMGGFSLAMSPLASTEWFGEIQWQSTRDRAARPLHRDDPGTVMTTNSPIAPHLFFWPIAGLATIGLLFGTSCGLCGYVRYRRRARHADSAS